MNNFRSQWFKDRIGKRVFRSHNYCSCKSCAIVFEKGLIISNEMHADYLEMTESDWNAEGFKMQYFDTKEEAEKFKSE